MASRLVQLEFNLVHVELIVSIREFKIDASPLSKSITNPVAYLGLVCRLPSQSME